MPKGFTEREKELIREALLEKGREIFERYGLKKTNIEDLTQAVGISKGAFYLFYESKEALFMDILEGFERDFRGKIFDAVYESNLSSREKLTRVLREALMMWDSYPLLRSFSREEYDFLQRKLPQERVEEHLRMDNSFVENFISKWNQNGQLIPHDPVVVAGLMKALFFVSLHKEDFGSDAYPGTMELLIQIVVNYLIPGETDS